MKRQRRIQQHARLSAALERQMARELTAVLNRAGNAAALHVEADRKHSAVNAALKVLVTLKPKMQRRLEASAMRAAEMQAEELKSFTDLETKAIDLGRIYREGVKTWAKRHAARLVENISETTRTFLQRILKRGVDEGKSNKEIAKDIRARLTGPAAARRAIRIARTETHTATQKGSYETAAQSGLEMEKEWGATEDARTRPTHAAADGQVVPLESPFVVGGAFMAYPGDPTGPAKEVINCRCVALYWPKGIRL